MCNITSVQAATFVLHLFSMSAYLANDAFHNADSAYQLPPNLWMTGETVTEMKIQFAVMKLC